MKNSQDLSDQIEDNNVSLKQFIFKAKDWLSYLLRCWKIIIPGTTLCASLGIGYAMLKKPNYLAELTFVLEDAKQNPLSAYAGLANQFGLDLGGVSGSGVFSGDNILQFLRSRLMVEKTLLSSVKINGRDITLAEHFMNTQEQGARWRKKEHIKSLHFPTSLPRNQFTQQQDSLLYLIYEELLLSHLNVAKPDKKLSFITVRCIAQDPVFAKKFSERLVKEATDFFITTKTQRSQVNIDKLQATTDSLLALLNQKTFNAAASQDLNLNPARKVATVPTEMVTRDKGVLMTMFAEATKNLELSKVAMSQETPIIQIVDTPIFPLKKIQYGKTKGMISWGLGGFLIISILLFAKRFYNKIIG